MTNRQLLSAIAQIDDRFILNAAPQKPSKRLWIRWISAAACLCLVLVAGITLWQSGIFTKPEPLPTPDPIPEGTGGDDNHDYLYAYHSKLYSFNYDLADWLEQQGIDVHKWLTEGDEATKQTKYTVSDPEFVPTVLEVVEEFGFPREIFKTINEEKIAIYQENEWYSAIEEFCFNEEELDALYSGDPATITRVFASPYAVVVGDRAFSPRFYLNATQEELQAYGITQEMITPKILLMRKDKVIESISPYSQYSDLDYGYPYLRKIYSLDIISELCPIEISVWAEKTYLESNFETVPSLLYAIETFHISKEDFEEANRRLIALFEQRNEPYYIKNYCFTQEEIDILYSGEGKAFAETFASPYAIVINGKAYAPSSYLGGNENIPQELIDQKRELLYEHGILG